MRPKRWNDCVGAAVQLGPEKDGSRRWGRPAGWLRLLASEQSKLTRAVEAIGHEPRFAGPAELMERARVFVVREVEL
jgi:hypothetical protein